MRVYLNELSIAGSFASEDVLQKALLELAQFRARNAGLAEHLICSVLIRDRPVCGARTVQSVLSDLNRDNKRLLLGWLNRSGPFMEEDRQVERDDYFSYSGVDVTDLGLGEAARRIIHRQAAATHSIPNGSSIDFCISPLQVIHGLEEDPIGDISVFNTWTVPDLIKKLQGVAPEPHSWTELVARCRAENPKLLIGDCERFLQPHPFVPAVARRLRRLCEILQGLMENVDASGQRNEKGNEIFNQYFVGENAWFSDESLRNKREFREEMTFTDPSDQSKSIECFWHGKTNSPKFRLHFQWPPVAPFERLNIVYMGPKISKR